MIEGRIFNFSAGPSMLADEVLLKIQSQLLNYEGSGMSVLEMSHRSKVYDEIIVSAEEKFRSVMNIPDNYKVLFLQGGATGMFAALAQNLGVTGTADYVISGNFSGNAYKEGCKFLKDARVAATTKEENFARIPSQEELNLNPEADYLHICFNNTIFGTRFPYIPETGDVPLVADFSSCILSEPVDISRFGVVYAGAQKNIAPAGLSIVIIREDLLGKAAPATPTVWNFTSQAEKGSMLNTPPTFQIYVCKLVLEWIESIGGLEGMKKMNEEKAAILYDYLDNNDFYQAAADKNCRSMMNVTFRTGSDELDAKFVKESVAAGMSNLKGHRLVGGMRASIYNAMPKEGVETLVAFMKKFAEENA